jgi:hypothetical protein
MQPNMLLIGLGVLLILGGVVLMTGQTLRRGRLSDVTRPRASTTNATLEPQGRAGTLGLKAHWPGLGLIALGALLLLALAAF